MSFEEAVKGVRTLGPGKRFKRSRIKSMATKKANTPSPSVRLRPTELEVPTEVWWFLVLESLHGGINLGGCV